MLICTGDARKVTHSYRGLQVADAPLARQSSAASGKPALWRRSVEPAPDPGGLHAALEVFSVKVEPAPGLVLWILRPLVWLVGILLASSKDTKNTPEKTFFVLLLGLRLPFC